MTRFFRTWAAAACFALPALSTQADEPTNRIVSVGGAITEIIYALGEQDRLVARDITSNYPPEALELPDVGYIRRLSPEGILSVNPDLIIAEEGSGPPEAVDLLKEAAINIVEIPDGFTSDAVIAKIHAVAETLGVPDKGDVLAVDVAEQMRQAVARTTGIQNKKVLFILSMQGGRVMASGQNTAADGIITLAGGENAVQGFDGYKPLTDEAITESGAEVILMMRRKGDHGLDDATLFTHPALSVLPAAQTRSVVRMDGMLLLGFSVRTAQAVTDLSTALAQIGG